MTLTKLKTKNQLTIPKRVLDKLNLGPSGLFSVEIQGNCIRLIPVEVEPRYTCEELDRIDHIVEEEKEKAKTVKAGKEFSDYIQSLR